MELDHKNIKINNKVLFEMITSNSPQTFSFPLKNEGCFIYVKQGQSIAYTHDEIVHIPKGNLAFANSGNLIFKSTPEENTSGNYQATVIRINKTLVLETLSDKFSKNIFSGNSIPSRDVVTGKACVIMNNYIEGIQYYFDNKHMISEEIMILKIKELLLLLLQSKKAKQVSNLLENFVNKNTIDFKKTVETHLYNNISLNELAHLCNMSLSTFKRNFKKVYNATPADYIIYRRLEKSKKLLLTSKLSLLDIAYDSGFKTVSHYSRKFKEKFGIPPSHYKLTLSGK